MFKGRGMCEVILVGHQLFIGAHSIFLHGDGQMSRNQWKDQLYRKKGEEMLSTQAQNLNNRRLGVTYYQDFPGNCITIQEKGKDVA